MSGHPLLSLHASTPEPLRAKLSEAFGRAQIRIVDAGAPFVVAMPELSCLPSNAPLVVLHGGPLTAEHGQAMRRELPPVLLACREGGLPSDWELEVLKGFLAGAALERMVPQSQYSNVGSLPQLKEASERAADAAGEAGARAAPRARAADVMYEIAANALLDAPVGPSGAPKYAHAREGSAAVEPSDACRVGFGVKDNRMYLSASDGYGRLTAEPLARAIESTGERMQLNNAGGGAGLGLRRVLENCELLLFRVKNSRATQVVGVVDLGDTRRRVTGPKSVFFTRRE